MTNEYEIKINGWGPCFHNEEEERIIQDWIDYLCPPRTIQYLCFGGQLEDILWLITVEYNGTVEFIADQWCAAIATGVLWKENKDGHHIDRDKEWRYSIYLQSDTMLAAAAACLACLRWKKAEIEGGYLDDIAHIKDTK